MSAALVPMREFFESHEQLRVLWELFSLDVILDANVIIQDIRWTLTKRKNPAAFPALREAIEAGTVRAVAPPELDDEVVEHLVRIAKEEGRDYREFLEEWEHYRRSIRFVGVEGEFRIDTSRDPDDAPYLHLQLQTGAVIRSDDGDMRGMGGRVIDAAVIVKLREYSQDATYVFSLRLGGVILSGLTFGLAKELWQVIQRGWQAAKKIPLQVLVLLLGFLVAVLALPMTREFIKNAPRKTGEALQPRFTQLLELTAGVHTEYMERLSQSEAALAEAKRGIPRAGGEAV